MQLCVGQRTPSATTAACRGGECAADESHSSAQYSREADDDVCDRAAGSPPDQDGGGLAASAGDYEDIRYELAGGIAKITIDRPEVRNAFRPETLIEVSRALESAREDTSVGVIVLTGEGPLAFCSGGDQRVRGDSGYVAGGAEVGRFHVTDLHLQMRRTPKPIVAMVAAMPSAAGSFLLQ